MEVVNININDLKEFSQNVRIHTNKNLKAIQKSIEKHGLVKNLVVWKETMEVICGNGTLIALKNLDYKEAPCVLLSLTEKQAKALSLADNRTNELSQNDEKLLIETLKSLEDDKDLFESTGYETDELNSLLEFIDGKAFDDQKKKEQKEKKEKKEEFKEVDGQLSFILNGIPFINAEKNQVDIIKELLNYYLMAETDQRSAVNKKIYNSIEFVLRQEFLGETPEEAKENITSRNQ